MVVLLWLYFFDLRQLDPQSSHLFRQVSVISSVGLLEGRDRRKSEENEKRKRDFKSAYWKSIYLSTNNSAW